MKSFQTIIGPIHSKSQVLRRLAVNPRVAISNFGSQLPSIRSDAIDFHIGAPLKPFLSNVGS